MNVHILKPLLSIVFIVSTMLSVVFVKMENTRIGYAVLKMTRVEKSLKDERRRLDLTFARLTRPGRIEMLAAKKLDLRKAQKGQIVQLFYDENDKSTSISRIQ